MRSRILPVVGLSAVALAAATTLAPTAGAQGDRFAPSHSSSTLAHTKIAAGTTCYKQLDNDNGVGIVSQNFLAPEDDIADSQGADDFTLKAGCKATGVQVEGVYFNGPGPADSVNVTIYKNKKNKPGAVVSEQKNLKFKDAQGTGSFKITLKKAVNLDKGTYWVSVQANLEFGGGAGGPGQGEWGWNTNNTVRGAAAKWQNPGDAFGTGCVKYTDLLTCIPDAGEGGDFTFAILK